MPTEQLGGVPEQCAEFTASVAAGFCVRPASHHILDSLQCAQVFRD